MERAGEADPTPITDCRDRDWVSVNGIIRSVTLCPHGAGQTLEADVWDGTGELRLVWFGRYEIRGVRPGRRVVIQGRLSCPGGRPTIFNPRYELRSSPTE